MFGFFSLEITLSIYHENKHLLLVNIFSCYIGIRTYCHKVVLSVYVKLIPCAIFMFNKEQIINKYF